MLVLPIVYKPVRCFSHSFLSVIFHRLLPNSVCVELDYVPIGNRFPNYYWNVVTLSMG